MKTQAFSFIVRIWIDNGADGVGKITWHGLVRHVPAGEERYVKDLDEIVAFLASYLPQYGSRLLSIKRFWRRLLC